MEATAEDEAEAEAEAGDGDGDGRAPWPTDHLRHSKRKMDEFLADAPAPAPGGGLLDRFLDPDPAPARTMSGEDGDGFEHGDSLAELESSYQAWRLSSKFRGSKDEDEAPAPAAAAAPAPSDDLAALEVGEALFRRSLTDDEVGRFSAHGDRLVDTSGRRHGDLLAGLSTMMGQHLDGFGAGSSGPLVLG